MRLNPIILFVVLGLVSFAYAGAEVTIMPGKGWISTETTVTLMDAGYTRVPATPLTNRRGAHWRNHGLYAIVCRASMNNPDGGAVLGDFSIRIEPVGTFGGDMDQFSPLDCYAETAGQDAGRATATVEYR